MLFLDVPVTLGKCFNVSESPFPFLWMGIIIFGGDNWIEGFVLRSQNELDDFKETWCWIFTLSSRRLKGINLSKNFL